MSDRFQNSAAPRIPEPVPTLISQKFWSNCANRQLVYQHCVECNQATFIPQEFCRYCHSEHLAWKSSEGRGEIYSYSEVWRPQTAAFPVPYVVAIIHLREGYYMLSNIIDYDARDLRIGAEVEADFVQLREGVWLPQFRPSRKVGQ